MWFEIDAGKVQLCLVVRLALLVAAICHASALHAEGTTMSLLWRKSFSGVIHSMAFSKDGSSLFVADTSGTLFCFDRSGRELWHWRYPSNNPLSKTITTFGNGVSEEQNTVYNSASEALDAFVAAKAPLRDPLIQVEVTTSTPFSIISDITTGARWVAVSIKFLQLHFMIDASGDKYKQFYYWPRQTVILDLNGEQLWSFESMAKPELSPSGTTILLKDEPDEPEDIEQADDSEWFIDGEYKLFDVSTHHHIYSWCRKKEGRCLFSKTGFSSDGEYFYVDNSIYRISGPKYLALDVSSSSSISALSSSYVMLRDLQGEAGCRYVVHSLARNRNVWESSLYDDCPEAGLIGNRVAIVIPDRNTPGRSYLRTINISRSKMEHEFTVPAANARIIGADQANSSLLLYLYNSATINGIAGQIALYDVIKQQLSFGPFIGDSGYQISYDKQLKYFALSKNQKVSNPFYFTPGDGNNILEFYAIR